MKDYEKYMERVDKKIASTINESDLDEIDTNVSILSPRSFIEAYCPIHPHYFKR